MGVESSETMMQINFMEKKFKINYIYKMKIDCPSHDFKYNAESMRQLKFFAFLITFSRYRL